MGLSALFDMSQMRKLWRYNVILIYLCAHAHAHAHVCITWEWEKKKGVNMLGCIW